eukprot:3778778-Pyramimonas_sp.AAC.1
MGGQRNNDFTTVAGIVVLVLHVPPVGETRATSASSAVHPSTASIAAVARPRYIRPRWQAYRPS